MPVPPEGYELIHDGGAQIGDKIWATEPTPHWIDVDEEQLNWLGFLDARLVSELHACARKPSKQTPAERNYRNLDGSERHPNYTPERPGLSTSDSLSGY